MKYALRIIANRSGRNDKEALEHKYEDQRVLTIPSKLHRTEPYTYIPTISYLGVVLDIRAEVEVALLAPIYVHTSDRTSTDHLQIIYRLFNNHLVI